ncbi:MAG: ribonuclease III [Sulfurospirillum sp.]|nr:ribonuclease III [Sulfurospirillum sp.]MBL0702993.1 ribonuclease III [Sulfurospirillum sp.]
MLKKLLGLQKRLNYKFKNQNLLIEALTHKSYKKAYNNERLEFLGDAILDLVVGEYLFFKFTNIPEGDLSKLRASLVNEKGLEKLARMLKLGECMYLSMAEEKNDGREKPSLLSDSFEAVVGALYLEVGLKKVYNIIIPILESAYPKIDLESIFRDYKTTLQEHTQACHGTTPEYITERSFGPDHQKKFEISVNIKEKQISKAFGKSKKEAQQNAAKIALEIIDKG